MPVDRWPGTDHPARPKLYAPEGATELFRRVVGAWGNDDLIENAFEIEEFSADSVIEIGSMRFSFKSVPHFTETFAIDIASMNGGGRVTYGADCSPNDTLVEFARGTDLLIVEATLPRPERTGKRGHLTPHEAGEHASRAGVKRVLLTHVSDELDALWVCKCAKLAYAGPIEVAREGAVYTT
jgi:ribonuclease BN (tRNA processing enzyme)